MTSIRACDQIVRDLLDSDSKLRDMLTNKTGDKLLRIDCTRCSNEGVERNARAYITVDPTEVVLCANKLQSADKIAEVLRHESVHAYDLSHNRYDLDTCEGLAASEVRAAREGECANTFSWFKNSCIKAHAEAATKNLFPGDGAKCVQKVFETAVADMEPINAKE